MTERDRADVVVVGAGILGVCTAHHLLARGAGRVVVLDASRPAGATSGAGAGFVGLWAAGYADFLGASELELQRYGVDFYRGLAADGAPIDCRTNGNLFLATTDEGWRKWVEPVAGHALAPEGTRALSPADVESITGGCVAGSAVVGGALHPGGIQISAGRATRAVAGLVEAAGGEIRYETPVTALIAGDGGVRGVRTAAGDVAADAVVLACGAWLNELLADVDATVPLLRMVATRVISPPSGVVETMPTVMVPDLYGLWLREHRGGLTWGNGDGYAPLYTLGTGTALGGQPRRDELVERVVDTLGPKLRTLVPTADTSVGWWLQGMPVMTSDRKFLAGPVPGVPGLFAVGGDNEAGVTHGPGLGRVLAELVDAGGTDWIDVGGYRLDRFADGAFPDEEAVLAAMPARR